MGPPFSYYLLWVEFLNVMPIIPLTRYKEERRGDRSEDLRKDNKLVNNRKKKQELNVDTMLTIHYG